MFVFVCLIMFNVTFNNISVISWRSVLLMEETGCPWENHRPIASHWQTWSHNAVHLALAWSRFKLTTSVVIGTDCIGICKSNYHTTMATMAPQIVYMYVWKCNKFMKIWKLNTGAREILKYYGYLLVTWHVLL
jgi:hypothetical protein